MTKILISLSNNYSRRKARLIDAENKQDTKYSVSQFVQIMKEPQFDSYFNGPFKALLKGKSEATTMLDHHISVDSELDVVSFIASQLTNTNALKQAKLGDRNGVSIVDGHRNSRHGSRKGVVYT